jgi:hypothetical protein
MVINWELLRKFIHDMLHKLLFVVDALTSNEYSGRILVKSVAVSLLSVLTVYLFVIHQSLVEVDNIMSSVEQTYNSRAKNNLTAIDVLIAKINNKLLTSMQQDFVNIVDAEYLVWLNSKGEVIMSEPNSYYLRKAYEFNENINMPVNIRLVSHPYDTPNKAIEVSFLVNEPYPYGYLICGFPATLFSVGDGCSVITDAQSILVSNVGDLGNLIINNDKLNLRDYNSIININSGYLIPYTRYRIGYLSTGLSIFRFQQFTSMSGITKHNIIGLLRVSSSYLVIFIGILFISFWCYFLFNHDFNIRRKAISNRNAERINQIKEEL